MKVLVIDEEPDALEAIMDVIRSAKPPAGEDYDVEGLTDYRQAFQPPYSDDHLQVLVTDMVMGDKQDEGIEVVEYFANKLPITIVLTGYPNYPNCVRAMRAGAWDYIEKEPGDGADAYGRLLDSMAKAYEYYRQYPDRSKTNPDNEWVHSHLDELVDKYPGQLVAVLYNRVVASGTEFTDLLNRTKKEFPLAKATIVSMPDPGKEFL